jgi:hypothetical protein
MGMDKPQKTVLTAAQQTIEGAYGKMTYAFSGLNRKGNFRLTQSI